MLIINNKEFNNPSINISFGKYSVHQNGIDRDGYSPFISFKYTNLCIGIETNYDKNWLKELKQNFKEDISKYISDITYEDEKGWISLINGNYKCFISKVEDNIFTTELRCETQECGEYFDILINEKIHIDF